MKPFSSSFFCGRSLLTFSYSTSQGTFSSLRFWPFVTGLLVPNNLVLSEHGVASQSTSWTVISCFVSSFRAELTLTTLRISGVYRASRSTFPFFNRGDWGMRYCFLWNITCSTFLFVASNLTLAPSYILRFVSSGQFYSASWSVDRFSGTLRLLLVLWSLISTTSLFSEYFVWNNGASSVAAFEGSMQFGRFSLFSVKSRLLSFG